MKRIVCDKCGADAPLRPEWLAVQISLPTETISLDLCKRCASRLKRWVTERDAMAGA